MATEAQRMRIGLVSADRKFLQETKAAFVSSEAVEPVLIEKEITDLQGEIQQNDCKLVIVDMDATRLENVEALQRVMRRLDGSIPFIVVTAEFNPAVIRVLVQIQVADFLVKPVSTADLVRASIRALKGPSRETKTEAEIYTFYPAAGGVGTSVLAIETAFQLHNSLTGARSTCVVDLNFQQGSCAEYLDLEPRFDLAEVENQPERLDRQLLDVMLSKHSSGLCVLAAPTTPTEMRSFNADVVVRILDLVSAYFDNVVIDMPRTWFPWTDTVLLGTNRLFIVSEMTVPCLRHTQRIIEAIDQSIGKEVKPEVIINRFEERGFEAGLKKADVEEVLGAHFAGGISNNYRLVREAVDRGVPLRDIDPNANVISDLKAIILPEEAETVVKRRPAAGLLNFGKSLLRKAS